MIGLMVQFLGEEACEGDVPGQEKVSVNDILRQLTRLVLDEVDGVTEKIDMMIAETPEEEKRSREWQIVGGYFRFLKELAAAEDKEGFLTGADVVMVGLMRQLSGEDAGDGDLSEEEER